MQGRRKMMSQTIRNCSLSPSLRVVGHAVPLLGGKKAGRKHPPHAIGEVNGRGVHLMMMWAWANISLDVCFPSV